ncbi:phage tail protein [Vreelandella malpeensis]|uniref:Phage tail protein n=1 Tax=Vreelandella malpeensis TaxID=1172368 RepID=A0ABS8DUI3_9GAMM|nr:phage tail protein [Halomonas malpeensis]MCB8889924.1 phage tail protein [Halomonas malpeensis]
MQRLPEVGRYPGIAYGLEETPSYARSVVKFGDGYEQRSRRGINPLLKSWSMRWPHLKHAEVKILVGFINAAGGVDAFLWTHPITKAEHKVVCDDGAKIVYDAKGRATVTATLREVVA